MANRTWCFALLTSITFFVFYLLSKTIAHDSSAFALLSAVTLLAALYHYVSANKKQPQRQRIGLALEDK